MLIPSAVPVERSSGTHVERGKVWAVCLLADRLRDVPTPRESVPNYEGPPVRISWGAFEIGGEIPQSSLVQDRTSAVRSRE
jgi:hypothetical protein